MLYYCIKCEKKQDITKSLYRDGEEVTCSFCDKPMTYFGSEAVVLSSESLDEKKRTTIDDENKSELVDELNSDLSSELNLSRLASFTGKNVQYETEKLDPKLLECQEFLRSNPNHIPSLIYMGLYFRSEGKYDKCIEYLELASDLNPKDIDVLKHLADIYLSLDEIENAIKKLLKIRSYQPDNYVVYKNIGMAHSFTKNYKDALLYFKWALSFCENEKARANLNEMIDSVKKEMI
ncbi:tetratricopeptide repeat protein [bacterium]|jgi:tetratricopeptide (TPR) repeat protein|nr:tetratricopeptide repeat protein [bacterium]